MLRLVSGIMKPAEIPAADRVRSAERYRLIIPVEESGYREKQYDGKNIGDRKPRSGEKYIIGRVDGTGVF